MFQSHAVRLTFISRLLFLWLHVGCQISKFVLYGRGKMEEVLGNADMGAIYHLR